MSRLSWHRFPTVLTAAATHLVDGLGELTGHPCRLDDAPAAARLVGPLADVVDLTLRDTVAVTRLDAGYASNVVPGRASAVVDCRVLPGRAAAFEQELAALLDDVEWDALTAPGCEQVYVDTASGALASPPSSR